jgi:hypothetical protein
MKLVTFTEMQLSENPSLADGLVFLSKDSEAQTRTFIQQEVKADPESKPTTTKKPKSKKK